MLPRGQRTLNGLAEISDSRRQRQEIVGRRRGYRSTRDGRRAGVKKVE